MKNDEGLFKKYIVNRIDGKDAPGQKHELCDLFVLDLTHDPHAIDGLLAYAISCRDARPKLSEDLMEKVRKYAHVGTEITESPKVANEEAPRVVENVPTKGHIKIAKTIPLKT